MLKVAAGSKVAFQGEPGAFSHHAVRKIFGNGIETVPCFVFDDVFRAVARSKAEFAVIPIENSLAGSIHQNFDLLARHSLDVIAETSLRVEHSLIVHPGASLRQIRQIYSHPAAMEQCKRLMGRLRSIEKVSFYDTAGSVKMLKEKELKNAAAVASERAAKLYKMKILARNIADNPENYTRFFVLSKEDDPITGKDKTSIIFAAPHKPGSLYNALGEFAKRGINLMRIESRPTKQKPWEYNFYLDFEGHRSEPRCAEVIEALREFAVFVKILGSYPKAS